MLNCAVFREAGKETFCIECTDMFNINGIFTLPTQYINALLIDLFLMETDCVLCEVRTEFVSVVEVASIQTVKTELNCFHHILLNAPFVNMM
jgi:hypothetical protein